jgi:2'-5' RNA ligase
LSAVRPNWFFGFPLDGSFLLQLPAPPPGFRRYGPEDVHITLTFLGGCGEAAAQRALQVLDERLPLAQQPPIAFSLGEVTAMGSSRAYSALSALLARGREETETCIAALRDPLTEIALGRREKRAPKAHVTIARPLRRANDSHRLAGREWAARLDLSSVKGTLDRIALYTWNEDRHERLFRVVAERRLA